MDHDPCFLHTMRCRKSWGKFWMPFQAVQNIWNVSFRLKIPTLFSKFMSFLAKFRGWLNVFSKSLFILLRFLGCDNYILLGAQKIFFFYVTAYLTSWWSHARNTQFGTSEIIFFHLTVEQEFSQLTQYDFHVWLALPNPWICILFTPLVDPKILNCIRDSLP